MQDNPESGVDIEYLFAKLEYRKSTSFNLDNHEISCTSVEGGKACGSRLELSLISRSMPNKDQKEKIMKTALKMAELMDMQNMTTVYGQVRGVPTDIKQPILGPDDFKYVPQRPSDFVAVKRKHRIGGEYEPKFDDITTKEEGNAEAKDSNIFQGAGTKEGQESR
jgi:hypothetical protein